MARVSYVIAARGCGVWVKIFWYRCLNCVHALPRADTHMALLSDGSCWRLGNRSHACSPMSCTLGKARFAESSCDAIVFRLCGLMAAMRILSNWPRWFERLLT